jgi:hypothetical protein
MWSCIVASLPSILAINFLPSGDEFGMAWAFLVTPASGLTALWAAMVLIAGVGERGQ